MLQILHYGENLSLKKQFQAFYIISYPYPDFSFPFHVNMVVLFSKIPYTKSHLNSWLYIPSFQSSQSQLHTYLSSILTDFRQFTHGAPTKKTTFISKQASSSDLKSHTDNKIKRKHFTWCFMLLQSP